jgi:hypothetical protein
MLKLASLIFRLQDGLQLKGKVASRLAYNYNYSRLIIFIHRSVFIKKWKMDDEQRRPKVVDLILIHLGARLNSFFKSVAG